MARVDGIGEVLPPGGPLEVAGVSTDGSCTPDSDAMLQSGPSRPRPLLRDPIAQARFERDGALVLPFLEPSAVIELRALWEEVGPISVSGIYSNVHNDDAATSHRVADVIHRLFDPWVQDTFIDCYLAGQSFLVKGTGPDSDSKIHQDWNNVDERAGVSLNIWCPLVDVGEHNGALQVVRGSHRLFDTVRGITTPSVYLEFDDELEAYLTPLPARAGDAVLYAHNLLHGSKPNETDEIRVCAVAGVLPLELDHLHYWQPSGTEEIRVLGVDREFFYSGLLDLYRGVVPAGVEDRGTIQRDTLPLERSFVLASIDADRSGSVV